ncbi:MAG: hypothetical protein MUF18_10165 [Fimbriiglobus sp.]|jgi:hypothetical protein|nr:hypothetical protein [Fimbriiglobus sp.]
MPPVSFRVTLSGDLAAFVNDAVVDGVFESADHLFAHAVALVRTQTAIGHTPEPWVAPPPVPTPDEVFDPAPESPPPAVDLTRKGFDGVSFMANLVDRLEKKRAEEKKPPK